MSDDNFYIAVMKSLCELILDIIDGDEIGIAELLEKHRETRHTGTACTDEDDISHYRKNEVMKPAWRQSGMRDAIVQYTIFILRIQVFLYKKTRLERIELPTRGFGDLRSTTEL